jgi:hypothetical protein
VRRWWQSLSFTPPPLPYKGLSSIPTAPREQTGSEIRLVRVRLWVVVTIS